MGGGIDDLIFHYDGLADGRRARGKSGSTNTRFLDGGRDSQPDISHKWYDLMAEDMARM